jgi:hypothetical protein
MTRNFARNDPIRTPKPVIDRARWLGRCEHDGRDEERKDRPSHAVTHPFL